MIPQKTSTKISKKIETDFEKSKKFKFILTFIGSLIYGVGGLTSIGINQFSVYITSYFYHNNVFCSRTTFLDSTGSAICVCSACGSAPIITASGFLAEWKT